MNPNSFHDGVALNQFSSRSHDREAGCEGGFADREHTLIECALEPFLEEMVESGHLDMTVA